MACVATPFGGQKELAIVGDRFISMSVTKLKVFIYGSCVSRDTAELRKGQWDLLEYVARQSLISAANAPIPLPSEIPLPSPFQRSMVENDFGSTLFPALRLNGAEADRVVIDLVDERLGVYPYDNGGYLTFSTEMNQSAVMKKVLGRGKFLDFGTEGHFEVWAEALDKLVALLDDLGLVDKVRVIKSLFVDLSDDGSAVMLTRGIDASEWNRRYARYYALIQDKGLRVVDLPTESLTSSRFHRWGPAQYHYVDSAYESLAGQIEAT